MTYLNHKISIILYAGALLVVLMGGCGKGREWEGDGVYYDGKDFFNKLNRELVSGAISGSWQVFAEDDGEGFKDLDNRGLMFRYARYGDSGSLTVCGDSVYHVLKTARLEKNDAGFELVAQSDTYTEVLWLIYRELDTLYFTSPENTPRLSWKAKKIDDKDFEAERQASFLSHYISGLECPPEYVADSAPPEYITGRWQLVKDVLMGIDYSCDNIVYDFLPDDSTLIVTGSRPGYAYGVFRFDYSTDASHWMPVFPFYLTVGSMCAYANVLEKVMIIGDSTQKDSVVFIRVR
ncbi:MAG: hypothetical protein LBI58_04695 [Tannerellaceae bacterium]|jgi:hypothetical protein|nr:hypothetical protein [Tannerellaceae bacterium]